MTRKEEELLFPMKKSGRSLWLRQKIENGMNYENSLSSVLTIAYLSAMQYYFIPVREMPTGRGFADYVFLPKPEYAEEMPALLVELKWNKKATTALQQIKDKNYVQAVAGYIGNILLVGISYDKKSKEHELSLIHI